MDHLVSLWVDSINSKGFCLLGPILAPDVTFLRFMSPFTGEENLFAATCHEGGTGVKVPSVIMCNDCPESWLRCSFSMMQWYAMSIAYEGTSRKKTWNILRLVVVMIYYCNPHHWNRTTSNTNFRRFFPMVHSADLREPALWPWLTAHMTSLGTWIVPVAKFTSGRTWREWGKENKWNHDASTSVSFRLFWEVPNEVIQSAL